MTRADIHTVPDVTEAALELVVDGFRASVAAQGRFVLALSGGSTPLPVYRALAGHPELPWNRCWVLWGDERHVPPDHERRNARAAREALLNAVPVPETQILDWPWQVGIEAEAAAVEFAATLRRRLGNPPLIDLNLLGLGDDGHTASLFPGSGAVYAGGLCTAVRTETQPEPRLSLTAAGLSNSRVVAFLVAGEPKRAALEGTLAGEGDLDRWPARAIGALERVVVLTDLTL